eukprot:2165761-Pleurochrysis_carterae.AAC.3
MQRLHEAARTNGGDPVVYFRSAQIHRVVCYYTICKRLQSRIKSLSKPSGYWLDFHTSTMHFLRCSAAGYGWAHAMAPQGSMMQRRELHGTLERTTDLLIF